MTPDLLIQTVLDWLLADPAHVVAVASALAALTPTPAADSVGGKIYKLIDLLALNILNAKDRGPSGSGPGAAPAVALAAAVAACAGQSPSATVFETRAAYDATVLAPLVQYHALPQCPTTVGACRDAQVDRQLIQADADAKTALDAAEDLIRFHPGADPAALVADAQTAVAAVQTIMTNHGVK